MKTTNLLILNLFLIQTISCGAVNKPVFSSIHNQEKQTVKIYPKEHYEIVIRNRPDSIRVKGSQVSLHHNELIIDSKNNQTKQVYDRSRVAMIYQVIKPNRKKTSLIGLGIGSGVGFALGWIGPAAVGFKNCNNAGDIGDCETFKKIAWSTLPISTIVFGLAGLGIGALTGKHHRQ